MYKNESRTKNFLVSGILGVCLSVLPITVLTAFLIFAIMESEKPAIVFSGIGLVIFLLILIVGVKRLRLYATVSFVNRILEKNADGIVSMDEILHAKGAHVNGSFEKSVIKCYESDLFDHLTYDQSKRRFELSDRSFSDPDNGFIGKNCPNCGAPLKIRRGTVVICDRCGSEVSG